jgi:PAS domain S-box-containing protein
MIDNMNEEMVKAVIETLPVELTVIDANDEVVGWNKHEKRLFKRPLSSLGLNFRDCHPAESLDKVLTIIDEMKVGKRDKSRFWIDMSVQKEGPAHKILIEFFALRDDQGKYLGCMESTQDITELKTLTGEKRLIS